MAVSSVADGASAITAPAESTQTAARHAMRTMMWISPQEKALCGNRTGGRWGMTPRIRKAAMHGCVRIYSLRDSGRPNEQIQIARFAVEQRRCKLVFRADRIAE